MTERNLVYNAERHTNTISASTLGGMLHLADIGDVDATTIKDNAILVYKKDADCSENCDGKNGWIGLDPSEAGDSSLDYIMGSDADGEVKSLMPPANSSQFYYLTWAGQNKASWKQPTVAASAPVDSDGKVWRLYVDPNTHELLIVKENPYVLQMHGFYMDKEEKTLRFDIVVSFDAKDRREVHRDVTERVQKAYPDYTLQIAMDIDFSDIGKA